MDVLLILVPLGGGGDEQRIVDCLAERKQPLGVGAQEGDGDRVARDVAGGIVDVPQSRQRHVEDTVVMTKDRGPVEEDDGRSVRILHNWGACVSRANADLGNFGAGRHFVGHR